MARFTEILAERRARYLIVDEETEKELPFLRVYLADKVPEWDLRRKNMFVKIYKVS